MGNLKKISKYCTSCGLCTLIGIELKKNAKGYLEPDFNNINQEQEEFLKKYCYVSNNDNYYTNNILRFDNENIYTGWSNNEYIRHRASTGGIITSLAIYLVEEKNYFGVLHIGKKNNSPLETECHISRSRDEIISNSGSRYTTSSTMVCFKNTLEDDKKYVIVGKPCEINSIRKYIDHNNLRNKYFLISFFCAGVPSEDANVRLINSVGIDEKQCKNIDYRGNGWPGKCIITDSSSNKKFIEYEDSWGKILGRDIKRICRFCWDGLGECADISCGDAWYLKDMKPNFAEQKGRNYIIVHTSKGKEILNDIFNANQITIEKYIDVHEFKYVQNFQFQRKATMNSKILAMKLMHKSVPTYNRTMLRNAAKMISFRYKFRIFLGTIKRVIKKKI